MQNIIFTGGNGRFGSVLKKSYFNKRTFYLSKKEFNILSLNSMEMKIKKINPKIIVHMAALSRPLSDHYNKLDKSIDLNIIGTANIVKLCKKYNIKLIYLSTHYVYRGDKKYSENDPVLPKNNYSWSKLGGECAVQMYLKNSLIIRVSMYSNKFEHKYAYTNVKSNFLTHSQFAKIFPKLLKFKGVLNIGGKTQTIFNFAKKLNPNVKRKKINLKKISLDLLPDSSTNISKMKKLLKKKI